MGICGILEMTSKQRIWVRIYDNSHGKMLLGIPDEKGTSGSRSDAYL
jgi:hypothetical protein